METTPQGSHRSKPAVEFDLQGESIQCKVKLQTFTADLMESLRVSSNDMTKLVEADRSRKDRNVYFHLPFCFAQAFPVGLDALRQLSYAGVLWISYARFQDDVIDGSAQASATYMLLKDLYLIESLRQMHGVLGSESTYWSYFDKYHSQFVEAILQEKYREADRTLPYSDETFRTIATGKAAMAKCAVAALGVLGAREAAIGPLAESLDAYHIAYQRYDDVVDWKADLSAGARTQLLDAIEGALTPQERALAPDDRIRPMARALHYKGIADGYLSEAIRWCERASWLAAKEGCRTWVGNVQRLQTVISALQGDLRTLTQEELLAVDEAEHGPSEHPLVVRRSGDVGVGAIGAAITAGTDYLAAAQRSDGTWADFLHGGTRSVDWTTAYVGMHLKEVDGGLICLESAARALCARQHSEGGWGWNLERTPVDADSTSCALVFLEGWPGVDREARGRALRRLGGFFDATGGGYATYADDSDLRAFLGANHPRTATVQGWCSAQVCVTALATKGQLGYQGHEEVRREEVEVALDFLRGHQSEDGYWNAYWWDGAFYSTFHCVNVLSHLGAPADAARVGRALRWLRLSQAEDGSWGQELAGGSRCFSTALAVSALLLRVQDDDHRRAAQRGLSWIVRHQFSDGSWPTGRILRIPRPHSVAPWSRSAWRESPTELNVLLRDDVRLFTTSTAMRALNAARHAFA